MATFTPNYNLRKPVNADLVVVASDLDANFDIIDTELKARQTAITGLDTRTGVIENPPLALIRKTATQSIPDTASTQVLFQTDAFSSVAGFANQANERLVVPVAGWYQVEFQVVWAGTAGGGRRDVDLNVNAIKVRTIREGTAAAIAVYSAGIFLVPLLVGDLITLNVSQTAGVAVVTQAGAASTDTETYLSARFIRSAF